MIKVISKNRGRFKTLRSTIFEFETLRAKLRNLTQRFLHFLNI